MITTPEKLNSLLACPVCGGTLDDLRQHLRCRQCATVYAVQRGIPILLSPRAAPSANDEVSAQVWDKLYQHKQDQYDPLAPPREIATTAASVRKILHLTESSAGVFVEAGCGTGRTSLEIARHSKLTVICLDRSLVALLKARQLFEQVGQPAYYLCADLRALPFRTNCLDYVFSDGTIEHFKETRQAVGEFHRALKMSGQVLAIVPHLALGMLTYGQRQGNIPNLFLIRDLLEFWQVRVLKSKFLVNGFELSFTPGQLKRILGNFDQIRVGYFHSYNEISLVRNLRLKKILRRLSRSKLFCPLIYGYGIKSKNTEDASRR